MAMSSWPVVRSGAHSSGKMGLFCSCVMCFKKCTLLCMAQKQVSQVGQMLSMTSLLPTVHCVSPRQAIEKMREDGISSGKCDKPRFSILLVCFACRSFGNRNG